MFSSLVMLFWYIVHHGDQNFGKILGDVCEFWNEKKKKFEIFVFARLLTVYV
jgi:hypothetical protein